MAEEEANSGNPARPATFSGKLFEVLSQAAAVASGLTVVLAVLYNWAYFSTVAPQVSQLLTINDQVSSALQWLPATVLAFLANIVVNFAIFFVVGINDLKGDRSLNLGGINLFVHIVMFFVLIIVYFCSGPSDWAWVAAVIGVWISYFIIHGIMNFGELKETIFQRFLDRPKLFFVVIILFGFFAVSLLQGNADGLRDFRTQTGNAVLSPKEGSQIASAIVLREIEKGVLLRTTKDNKIIFVPWEDVSELTVSPNQISSHDRICVDFNLFCSFKDPYYWRQPP